MLLLTVTSWLDQREREVLAYLIEENRVLQRQLGERRLRLCRSRKLGFSRNTAAKRPGRGVFAHWPGA
jgi:hypothetical protein